MNKKFLSVFLKTINTWLWALCVISVVLVFVMDMWLLDIPAPNKFCEAIGKFNYGVAVSYIAAFIFYLISVHYPETKSAISLYTAAHFPAKAIVTNIEGIFIDMGKQLNKDVDRNNLNDVTIKDILGHTKCYSNSTTAKLNSLGTGTYTYFTWIEYLELKKPVIESFFKQLHPLYSKLDGEYINVLSKVEQNASLQAVLLMVPASLKVGHTKDSICFDNGLEEILLQLFHDAKALDIIITERDETFGIDDAS